MLLRIATTEDLTVILQLRLKMLEEVAKTLPEQLPGAIYGY